MILNIIANSPKLLTRCDCPKSLSWDQVNGIHKHQCEALKKNWNEVKRVGMDEIAKRKGHKSYVTVLSDLDKGELIEVIDSHEQTGIIESLMKQTLEVREKVEEVSVDMWGDFLKSSNRYSQKPKL